MIFDRGKKKYTLGKKDNMFGKVDDHMQKNETRPVSTALHQVRSKWIKTLNWKPETLNCYEKI